MNKALRSVMTPLLRGQGFTGTCPRFRRLIAERFDLLLFLLNKHHPSFLIEIAQCPSDWWRRELGDAIPPEKLTTWHLPLTRRVVIAARPRPPGAGATAVEDCFQFGDAQSPDDYRCIAESVRPLLEKAVRMFDEFESIPKPTGWPDTGRA
jgi:hypothetical protein